VVAIGGEEEVIQIKVGKVILLPIYTGTETKLEVFYYLIMEFDNILTIAKD
jgi:co-chaperonin GroES (HSP10)